MGRKTLGRGLDALFSNSNVKKELTEEHKKELDVAWDSAEETQRLEVYETALTRAWRDGEISADEQSLIEGIRDHLKITEEEHKEIEARIKKQDEIVHKINERSTEADKPGKTADVKSGEEETEHISCPKCSFDIEIEFTEDEKIHLQCPECGAKGRIPNPYMKKKKEEEKKEEKKDKKREKKREDKKVKEKKAETEIEEELKKEEEIPKGEEEPLSEPEPKKKKPPAGPKQKEKKLDEEKEEPEKEAQEEPEPPHPLAKRTGEYKEEKMVFVCPRCEAPFQTVPTEDPQDIPCPTCKKEVRIIKPINFRCPECDSEFPSILQTETKAMDCPHCYHTLELRK